MARIIISRELSFYHANSPIKVYVDGRLAACLHREGDIQEFRIDNDKSVSVSIREWGFQTRSVQVRSGQTVFISPRKWLVWLYYACFILMIVGTWKWYDTHPWPADQWSSSGHFWYLMGIQLPFILGRLGNNLISLFKLEVSDERPSGYFPTSSH